VKRERGDAGSHRWEARLSDYLDDELTAGERLELEDHLRGCASCAAVLEDLRAVVARADGCAREWAPASDLWEGIRPRLQPRRRRAAWRRALDVFTPSPAAPAWWRVPAFAAAAILVVGLASLLWLGGTTLRPSAPGEERGPYTQGEQGAGTLHSVDRAPRALEASREYYDTVAHLRRVVEERLTHDPRVVEVLDSNLAAIDGAIAGYRDALVANPADETLKRRLEQARERKVEILRQAAALATEAAN
jgi:predicted anti-sigma-YlaC factor YlaD